MKINLSGDLSNHAAEFCLAARESHLFPRSEMVETIFDRLSMTTSGLSSEKNSGHFKRFSHHKEVCEKVSFHGVIADQIAELHAK